MRFKALPGFRDFYPAEMAVRRHVESAWHAAARGSGFEEIDAPPLESLDLFRAKSGDAIVEELFEFTDKGGREVALRPELTPSLARMVGAKAAALRKPIKWYAIPQLFRYQRQQRGRLREHIQFNVDMIGAPEIAADAEVLAVAIDALRRLGLTEKDIYVRVSHKALAEAKLRDLGCTNDELVLRLIDKGVLDADKAEGALSAAATGDLLAWLDAPIEPDGELAEFVAACDDFGLGGFVEIDKNIVRGLAYYTGVVYEIFDRDNKLRAIAGGGRYDNLVEKLGGPALPALGFGMGDVVIAELLKDLGRLPDQPARVDTLVVPLDESMLSPARRVVRALRERGASAEAPYRPLKLGKAFKLAEQIGASSVAIVGPDEWAEKKVRIKDLKSGDEHVETL
ncbi:MAG: histidine--tRNA ligase [Planctomycetota bacterium]|jgi:histidyl-tRNA synthetase